MRRYLSTLHRQPPHHKKRFALLASSTITLFIFGAWSLATFGTSGTKIAENEKVPTNVAATENEVNPLQSLRMALATSFEALKDSIEELKAGFKAVDLEAEYKDMREKALDVYGQ